MKKISPLALHECDYMRVHDREVEDVMQPKNKTTVGVFGAKELRWMRPNNLNVHRHHRPLEHVYWIFVEDATKDVEVRVNKRNTNGFS